MTVDEVEEANEEGYDFHRPFKCIGGEETHFYLTGLTFMNRQLLAPLSTFIGGLFLQVKASIAVSKPGMKKAN